MTNYTAAQLAALDAAIASGVKVVQYDGQRTEYRSMDELRAARKIVAQALNAASGAVNVPYVNPAFDRGV